jgi:hypothetical protein
MMQLRQLQPPKTAPVHHIIAVWHLRVRFWSLQATWTGYALYSDRPPVTSTHASHNEDAPFDLTSRQMINSMGSRKPNWKSVQLYGKREAEAACPKDFLIGWNT